MHILKNKNYCKYFLGQLVSMSGTWMQSVALSWLVFRLSHSGYWLGIMYFCSQMPAFFLSPIAGVVVDRVPRRRILIAVQIFAAVQALLLAWLVFSGKVELWQVVLLEIGIGMITAFDITARHAFAIDMVGRGDLSSAIAYNSLILNSSRVFGPILAGVALAAFGEAWCFMLNGLSYIPVIVGLATMDIVVRPKTRNGYSVAKQFSEALKYVSRSPLIRRALIFSVLICLVPSSFAVLLPVFAKQVLAGGRRPWLGSPEWLV